MKISIRHIVLSALPLLFVATAHAGADNNAWDMPGYQAAATGQSKSRAEVVAELDQARAKGELSHSDTEPMLPQTVSSVVSREAVKQELAQYVASPTSGYDTSRDSDAN
jgi:Domain of unknown function (DUF4148)